MSKKICCHCYKKFEKDGNSSATISHLTVYNPIIPFKHYEKISQQIAWAANKQWREGNTA